MGKIHGHSTKNTLQQASKKPRKEKMVFFQCYQKKRKILLQRIVLLAEHSFPLLIKQICAFAWALVLRLPYDRQYPSSGPSEKWWRGFKRGGTRTNSNCTHSITWTEDSTGWQTRWSLLDISTLWEMFSRNKGWWINHNVFST